MVVLVCWFKAKLIVVLSRLDLKREKELEILFFSLYAGF